jgi:hypothetical protein
MRIRAEGEQSAAAKPGRPRIVIKFATLIAAVVLAAGIGEMGLRVFCRSWLLGIQDERNLLFRYDKALGWFPVANSQDRLLASRVISVVNNSEGFRAPERQSSNKPGILFLGDSFVWGFDVEMVERFTEKLQAKHPEWNILNFGVSGYGTDQEYLLLQKHFDAYKPQVVFLIFCTETDDFDNCSNMRYGGYYKPYCTVETNRLTLHGIPVPRGERAWLAQHDRVAKSWLVRLGARAWFKVAAPKVLNNPNPTGAIIRDLQKYVEGKGARLLVGLTKSNPRLEEFLRFFKIPYIDLTTSLRYPGFGSHWTPEGHSFVSEKVEEFLMREAVFEKVQTEHRKLNIER